jgi:hypothetical protein
VSPNQCRQARDILKWTLSGLAGAADVAPEVISAFEEGHEVSPGRCQSKFSGCPRCVSLGG